MSDVVIVSATRTPLGNLCGSLSSLKAHQLGGIVIKSALTKANVKPEDVREVIMGQALQAGQGQNPARQAAAEAGIPFSSSTAYSINMLCGSGLKSVCNAYDSILQDSDTIIVAGGQESMSQAPHVVFLRNGVKLGNTQLVDTMLTDGLTDVFHNIHMGETAENIGKQYGITRSEQDEYTIESQRRTEIAVSSGIFSNEITPVPIVERKATKLEVKDEFPKPDTKLEELAKLRPVFIKDGTVTPGNASGINDGAAAVVVMSAETAKKRNIPAIARIVGHAQAGCDPKIMGMGPVPAVQKLLQRIGWKLDDVDLFELNEAFAVQAIACVKELAVDPSKVNVHGGALSLGHPIGASGARILVTLINALKSRKARKGIASLCIGGGMGIALAVEIVS